MNIPALVEQRADNQEQQGYKGHLHQASPIVIAPVRQHIDIRERWQVIVYQVQKIMDIGRFVKRYIYMEGGLPVNKNPVKVRQKGKYNSPLCRAPVNVKHGNSGKQHHQVKSQPKRVSGSGIRGGGKLSVPVYLIRHAIKKQLPQPV